MNKVLKLIKYLLVLALGVIGTVYYLEHQKSETSPVLDKVGKEWLATTDLLKSLESSFSFDVEITKRKKGLDLTLLSEKSGDLWLYVIEKGTDQIQPICVNEKGLVAGKTKEIYCEFEALSETESMFFGFVTVSDKDEDVIRKYIQLRSALLPGQQRKGLIFDEGAMGTELEEESGIASASQIL
ncbi:MAG: hypothetical protein GJ680_07255 [Alteromonadaceae bacterium]|nr:hypothetical protein [Alteromonadaceae bacterium]